MYVVGGSGNQCLCTLVYMMTSALQTHDIMFALGALLVMSVCVCFVKHSLLVLHNNNCRWLHFISSL